MKSHVVECHGDGMIIFSCTGKEVKMKVSEAKKRKIRKVLGAKRGAESENGTFLKAATASRCWVKLREETNEKFFPLYFDRHRYLVLMGGGGSGKSIFAGRKVIERVLRYENQTVLVLRKVAKTLRESSFRQLVSQISQSCDVRKWNISKTDMSISSPNGSRIIFAGLDDAEKLKSIYGITMVWIEEASEITEYDFNQVDIRMRGQNSSYHQIILTFNPVSVSHWLKGRFFDRNDENALVMKSTYLDNRFLDDASRKVLEGFKDTDEYYYNVYCLGNWGVTGKSIFGSDKVYARLKEISPPVRTGEFTERENLSVSFVDTEIGCVKIYEEPKADEEYIMGGDTAGEGADYFVSQVISVKTGKQVAVIRMREDEDRYTLQSVNLCRYYNNALLVFESNFSTYPIREALRLGYKNQYIRRNEDTISRNYTPSYGFRTTAVTRPLVIGTIQRIFRESPEVFTDEDTLNEMLGFVRTREGRIEAGSGCHDDMIMALAIAHYVRCDMITVPKEEEITVKKANFAFEREEPVTVTVI